MRQKASAKSFIKNKMTEKDAEEIKQFIEERLQNLKNANNSID